MLHTVAETIRHDRCVVGEAVRRVPLEPAAARFDSARHLPVEQGGKRHDSRVEEKIDQTGVVIERHPVAASEAVRLYAGPGDREPVAIEPEPGCESDVGLGVSIAVTGRVCDRTVEDSSRPLEEVVPDRSS